MRRLSTPDKVQAYLDGLAYNLEKDGETLRSPRRVIRDGTAHCAEAAFLAAAAFRVSGRPPLVVDLEAVRDDDHVIAVYRDAGLWGAVALSKFAGLRFRASVYRTLRELVMSYFEDYYSWDGERTLRSFSRPVSLARFDRIAWMTSEDDLWPITDHLATVAHVRLLPRGADRRLPDVDRRSYEAGIHGAPEH
ncbi:MAG: hypothetical protein KGN00_08535 [Chloroflexota bacterium]|nr:hypothetical protein [Chloroflexota bacterium]MDE3193715.1 hypothetical protein [Chloroflexota bacterium]